jgi:hypothetical protein
MEVEHNARQPLAPLPSHEDRGWPCAPEAYDGQM